VTIYAKFALKNSHVMVCFLSPDMQIGLPLKKIICYGMKREECGLHLNVDEINMYNLLM